MGTTMVMACIEGDTMTIAHVGDSRCYLQRPDTGLIYKTKRPCAFGLWLGGH
jgi:protein phosphatase